MRYSIKLSYDGSAFNGWQVQPNAKTVQECLETSLSTLLRTGISVVGAGRTDSKVNAIGYIAHFDFDGPLDTENFGYKLNAILPISIVVHEVKAVGDDFHARFTATRREYTYFIHRKKDPFVNSYSWYCSFGLDVDAMNEAAKFLIGTHDFSCFEKVGSDNKTSICTVEEAYWTTYKPVHQEVMQFGEEGAYLYFRISADRFLRNMVRAVVGSLIDVGRGRRTVESFATLVREPGTKEKLQEKAGKTAARSMAGESVPGHALFLSKVQYPESVKSE